MLINNTHVTDILCVTSAEASKLLNNVGKHVKTVKMIPSNNKVIKYAHVIHFDLDEAIKIMSSIRATKTRLRVLGQLREIKLRLKKL